jgi:hypothetical protein
VASLNQIGDLFVDVDVDMSDVVAAVFETNAATKAMAKDWNKLSKSMHSDFGKMDRDMAHHSKEQEKFRRQSMTTEKALTDLRKTMRSMFRGTIAAGAIGLVQSLGAATVGAGALASAVVPAAGGLASLGASAGAAGIGVVAMTGQIMAGAQAFGVIKLAGDDVAKAFNAIDAPMAQLQKRASAGLLPGVKHGVAEVSRELHRLNPVIDATSQAIGFAASSFGEIAADLLKSKELKNVGLFNASQIKQSVVPLGKLATSTVHLANALIPLGEHAGDAMRSIMNMTSAGIESAIATGRIDAMIGAASVSMDTWGSIIRNTGSALIGTLESAWASGNRLAQALDSAMTSWNAFTDSTVGQQKMLEFFAKSEKSIDSISDLMHGVGSIMNGIMNAGFGSGITLIDKMAESAQNLGDWMRTAEGRMELSSFFTDSMPAVEEFGALLGDIGKMLINLASMPGAQKSIAAFRDFIPTLQTALDSLGGEFVPSMLHMAENMLKLFSELAPGIAEVMGYVADAVGTTADFIDLIPGLDKLAAAFIAVGLAAKGVSIAGALTGAGMLLGPKGAGVGKGAVAGAGAANPLVAGGLGTAAVWKMGDWFSNGDGGPFGDATMWNRGGAKDLLKDNDALKAYKKTMEEFQTVAMAINPLMQDQILAKQTMQRYDQQLATDQAAYNKAVKEHGRNSVEAKSAFDQLTRSQMDYNNAVTNSQSANQNFDAGLDLLTGKMDEAITRREQLQAQLLDIENAQSTGYLENNSGLPGGFTSEFQSWSGKDAQNRLKEARAAILETLAGMDTGFAKTASKIRELNALPYITPKQKSELADTATELAKSTHSMDIAKAAKAALNSVPIKLRDKDWKLDMEAVKRILGEQASAGVTVSVPTTLDAKPKPGKKLTDQQIRDTLALGKGPLKVPVPVQVKPTFGSAVGGTWGATVDSFIKSQTKGKKQEQTVTLTANDQASGVIEAVMNDAGQLVAKNPYTADLVANDQASGVIAAVNHDLSTIDGRVVTTTIKTVKTTETHKAGGGPVYKAVGGPIRGKGTGTSDDIPAMLSNGEFVVRADGSNLMDALHFFAAKGFAKGGPVADQGGSGAFGHIIDPLGNWLAKLKKVLQESSGIGSQTYLDKMNKIAERAERIAGEDKATQAQKDAAKAARARADRAQAKYDAVRNADQRITDNYGLRDAREALHNTLAGTTGGVGDLRGQIKRNEQEYNDHFAWLKKNYKKLSVAERAQAYETLNDLKSQSVAMQQELNYKQFENVGKAFNNRSISQAFNAAMNGEKTDSLGYLKGQKSSLDQSISGGKAYMQTDAFAKLTQDQQNDFKTQMTEWMNQASDLGEQINFKPFDDAVKNFERASAGFDLAFARTGRDTKTRAEMAGEGSRSLATAQKWEEAIASGTLTMEQYDQAVQGATAAWNSYYSSLREQRMSGYSESNARNDKRSSINDFNLAMAGGSSTLSSLTEAFGSSKTFSDELLSYMQTDDFKLLSDADQNAIRDSATGAINALRDMASEIRTFDFDQLVKQSGFDTTQLDFEEALLGGYSTETLQRRFDQASRKRDKILDELSDPLLTAEERQKMQQEFISATGEWKKAAEMMGKWDPVKNQMISGDDPRYIQPSSVQLERLGNSSKVEVNITVNADQFSNGENIGEIVGKAVYDALAGQGLY